MTAVVVLPAVLDLHAAGSVQTELLARRGDLLAVKDARSGRYVHVNEAMAGFLSRPAGDVRGLTDAELFDAPLATALRALGLEVQLAIELAPDLSLTLSITDGVSISPADVRAIRAAAAPLIAELAQRGLTPHPGGDA